MYPQLCMSRSPCHLYPTPETELWRLVLCMAGGVLKGRGYQGFTGRWGCLNVPDVINGNQTRPDTEILSTTNEVQMTFQRFSLFAFGEFDFMFQHVKGFMDATNKTKNIKHSSCSSTRDSSLVP